MTRIEYLESKLPKGKSDELEEKNWPQFEKYSSYVGSGVYEWRGFRATCTRELFLMGMLHRENIKFK